LGGAFVDATQPATQIQPEPTPVFRSGLGGNDNESFGITESDWRGTPSTAQNRALGGRILAQMRDADPTSQAAIERAALAASNAAAKANNPNFDSRRYPAFVGSGAATSAITSPSVQNNAILNFDELATGMNGDTSQLVGGVGVDAFIRGWSNKGRDWSVLEGERSVAYSLGSDARSVVSALYDGLTGAESFNQAGQAWRAGNYATATLHGMQGVGTAGLTALTLGDYALAKAAVTGVAGGTGLRVGTTDVALSSLEQVGINKLALPRTPGLGTNSTTTELLQTGAIPGREGVILTQRTVPFNDLWRLSENSGVEYVLTREQGNFVLRSGSPVTAPIPGGVRPIVHTHPLDANGVNSLLPSRSDINILNDYWARNPSIQRPVSQIITGHNQTTVFRATGVDQWKPR
jgi:hypothetical protein